MRDEAVKTKGQRTQERILKSAFLLFGQHGFGNTSIQMIADACELSQGAVTQHFASKARLLEACRKFVTSSNHAYVDSRILPTDDGYQALRKHLILNLEWAIKHPSEAGVIVLTYETGFHDPDYRDVAKGAIRLGTERIHRYLLAAQREKLIRTPIDTEMVADVLHEYLLGIITRTLSSSQPSRLSEAMTTKIDLVLESLTGISR